MNLVFGLVAILTSLGCLLLYFVVRSPHMVVEMRSSYGYLALIGAVLFFAAGMFEFYRHWRYENRGGDDAGEMV
jgi:hypothetical protein